MTQPKTSFSSYPSIEAKNKSSVNIGNRTTKIVNSGVSKAFFVGACLLFGLSGLKQTSLVQQVQNVMQAPSSPAAASPISQSASVNQTAQPTQPPQVSKIVPKSVSPSKPMSAKALNNQKDCPDKKTEKVRQ